MARRGGEPILAQLRLTWWRDRLGESPEQWPAGEPLLALLGAWQGELGVLAALVDDYERTIVDPDATDRSVLADARIAAMVALARVIGAPDRPEAVEAVAMRWATGEGGQPVRLSRLMRPLAILAELGAGKRGLAGWLGIVRLGMFGR